MLITKVMVAIIFLLALNKIILPKLISSKSDELVMAGLLLMAIEVGVSVGWVLLKIQKYNQEFNKKEKEKD